MINFRQATFLTSAAKLAQCPEDFGAEVAFAGRSNAGKSSSINALCDQRGLARTSKTPGRTQLINFFAMNDQQRLVDLPGYGFAKVPVAVKDHWQKHLGEYLEKRACLRGLVLLSDIRHPMKEFDIHMLEWAASAGMPVHMLLTKEDKLKRGPAKSTLLQVRKQVSEIGDNITVQSFSATKKTGLDTLRSQLATWLELDAADQDAISKA